MSVNSRLLTVAGQHGGSTAVWDGNEPNALLVILLSTLKCHR